VLFKFVDGLGSSAYNSAQKVACICVPEKQALNSSFIMSFDVIEALFFLLLSSFFWLISYGFLRIFSYFFP